MIKRLVAQDWIDFGLTVLARDGFEGLKADLLTRELGVTRGSFYWHFTDLSDYHAKVIAHWRELATEAVIVEIEHFEIPGQRLAALLRRAFSNTSGLDLRMRAWADNNKAAAAALAAIDDKRTVYMERLLSASGIERPVAVTRARLLYWSYLGAMLSRTPLLAQDLDLIVEELMAMAFKGSAQGSSALPGTRDVSEPS